MTALNQDQRFACLLIFALMGGSCLFEYTQAQTLTVEDRLSVLKFVGAFMNFLDMELENSTLATPGSTSTVETTSISSNSDSTETSTESPVTSDSSTTTATVESSSSSSDSTDPGTTITTTEATTTTVRRRMCFKRFCYKFSSDKGYIV